METNFSALPQLSILDAVKLNFARITDFKGRSRRSELWWNYLMYVVSSYCLSLIIGPANIVLLVVVAFVLQLLITPVTIRRMHDVGRSGWWVVAAVVVGLVSNVYGSHLGLADAGNMKPEELFALLLTPAYMVIYTLSMVLNLTVFVFAVMDGKKNDNKYGPSPKYVVEVDEE